MARKSRKNIMPQSATPEIRISEEVNLLRTAAYARLSSENSGHETEDESYADGILTRNEYLEKKKGLGEKLADLQEKIRIEEEEQETADELDEEIRSLTEQASQKTYIGGLTKECVDAFVSMVYLYDDQTMKVEFNCEDVIRRALEKCLYPALWETLREEGK